MIWAWARRDVEKVEPLLSLTTLKARGKAEYDRVAVVLLNAVKEQQSRCQTRTTTEAAARASLEQQHKLDSKKADLKPCEGCLSENREQQVCK